MRRAIALLASAVLVSAIQLPVPVAAATGNSAPCATYTLTNATISLPANYWTVGTHTFNEWAADEAIGEPGQAWGPWTFDVSSSAALYPGKVLIMGGYGTFAYPVGEIDAINPAQPTVLIGQYGLPRTGDITPQFLKSFYTTLEVRFQWDQHGEDWVTAQLSPLADVCTHGWRSGAGIFLRDWGNH